VRRSCELVWRSGDDIGVRFRHAAPPQHR
jgi:hypothetical protein